MSPSGNFASILGYLLFVILVWGSQNCDGQGTFGFDVHHRYSDQVKGILNLDGLPEKGTVEYYSIMADRDLFKGRRLADNGNSSSLLTFSGGNDTYRLNSLGFLHYANISVGTPSVPFLVALDTGSDLFWLPCDCTANECVQSLTTRTGKIDLNIYSPNTSSTSMKVPCNSTMCGNQNQCSGQPDTCAYKVRYLSANTSSTGFLVEDVLHLITDDSVQKPVDADITFGCGKVQTGSFMEGAAPNGLFGLGMEGISVPSILASKGLTANSFSMCFGDDGVGRITFGDKGNSDQRETPFTISPTHPTYNISVTQILVGDNTTAVNFSAIFDSGTSFTYLTDPAFTIMAENFNSRVEEKRHAPDTRFPFDYCYELRANQTGFYYPSMNLTMKGGSSYDIIDPIVFIGLEDNSTLYCLAIVKSPDIDIIGQNFMTGYRTVFDRERNVLGWKQSSCYDTSQMSTLPIDPRNTTDAVPPSSTVNPEAKSGPPPNGAPTGTPSTTVTSRPSNAPHLNAFTPAFFTVVIFLFINHFNILFA